MNKLNITAYMLFIVTVVTLCGCAGKNNTQMYLEAKVQDGQAQKSEANAAPGESSVENVQNRKSLDSEQGTAERQDTLAEQEAVSATCFVYVCGAVKHPGVFELPKGSRVYEAIALAGGLCEDAYRKGINQAQKIEDGDMIEVLTVEEQQESEKTASPVSAEEQSTDGLVNLNTATKEQLMSLNGIGEAKAANIIAYRESNGRFSAIEEIMNVNGIGQGVYAKVKDHIKIE